MEGEVAVLMCQETSCFPFGGVRRDNCPDLKWTQARETITVIRSLPSLTLIVVIVKSSGATLVNVGHREEVWLLRVCRLYQDL